MFVISVFDDQLSHAVKTICEVHSYGRKLNTGICEKISTDVYQRVNSHVTNITGYA